MLSQAYTHVSGGNGAPVRGPPATLSMACNLEDLDSLHQRQGVEVGREVEHQPVFDVEQHVARL